MATLANLTFLFFISMCLLYLLFSVFRHTENRRLVRSDSFTSDGKLSPKGYLGIQKELGKKYHTHQDIPVVKFTHENN